MLTDEQIDKLTGRELDLAIHLHILKLEPPCSHEDTAFLRCRKCGLAKSYWGRVVPPYFYSTDWGSAGEIVEYLALGGYHFKYGIDDENYYATFDNDRPDGFGVGYAYRGNVEEPGPTAIARAALKVKTNK